MYGQSLKLKSIPMWMTGSPLLQQSDQALKAVQAIQCISGKLGMILSLKKSTIFATKAKLTNTIQGQLAQHGLALGTIRNPTGLGINFQTMGQPSPEMRDKRWESAKILLERLQYMPWTTHRKTQILTRGIFPLIFYGCHAWRTGKEFLREVRAKCNHTARNSITYITWLLYSLDKSMSQQHTWQDNDSQHCCHCTSAIRIWLNRCGTRVFMPRLSTRVKHVAPSPSFNISSMTWDGQ